VEPYVGYVERLLCWFVELSDEVEDLLFVVLLHGDADEVRALIDDCCDV
jgi:hypothetical protein